MASFYPIKSKYYWAKYRDPVSGDIKRASLKILKTAKGLVAARRELGRLGDLMEFQEPQFADEKLIGVDRKLMGSQLAAWVSYLPGSFWDTRLPQPSRARGRRKL